MKYIILEVSCCDKCFYARYFDSRKENDKFIPIWECCFNPEETKPIDDTTVIPPWCPLPSKR